MADRYYDLQVAGCKRRLPILNLDGKLAIAAFVMLGDVELTEKCAQALAKKLPEGTDVLLTAETKGIPLAAEVARQMGMPWYIVARKSMKAYMENPLWVDDESITTLGKQKLGLTEADVERIRGRRVLLLDDVISTGGSMRALRKLAELAGGQVIGEAAVLAEGDAASRTDIIFLEGLPLFEAR